MIDTIHNLQPQNLFHNMMQAKFILSLYIISKTLSTLVLSLWEIKIMIFRLFMIQEVQTYGLTQLNAEMQDAKIINNMMAKEVLHTKN